MIVADSNVLIGLAKGGILDVLRDLHGEVRIGSAVWEEVVVRGHGRPGAAEVQAAADAGWLVVDVPDPGAPSLGNLKTAADREGVQLAYGLGVRLLTDDPAMRREAQVLGVPLARTLDVVVLARRLGLIASCQAVLDRMRASQFGFSDADHDEALRLSGECS